jgi:integrase
MAPNDKKPTRPPLSLFDPDAPASKSEGWIVHPPRAEGPAQGSLFPPGVPPISGTAVPAHAPDPAALQAHFLRVAQSHQEAIQPIPEALRLQTRETLTLLAFYERWMQPWREKSVRTGDSKKGTWKKERAALANFDRWDKTAFPEDWPAGIVWPGLPIAYITGPYLDRFLKAMQAATSLGYAQSTWNHLRTVFNFAVKVKALDAAPKPKPLSELSPDEEDLFAVTYTVPELGRIYDALAGWPDLQAAWVLGANAGPRSIDLFSLHWQTHLRLDAAEGGLSGELTYRAVKTGKTHWAPLAPVTVAHLRQLLDGKLLAEGPVFRNLTSHRAKDPEKSRAARLRNDLVKRAIQKAGLEVPAKPWQVLRATCSTRLNTHRPRTGKLMIHGLDSNDVNEAHYFDPRALLTDAVRTVPQPAEFERIFSS